MTFSTELLQPGSPLTPTPSEASTSETSTLDVQAVQVTANLEAHIFDALVELNVSPAEVLQLAAKALAEGCRVAGRYFEAAILLTQRNAEAGVRAIWLNTRHATLTAISTTIEPVCTIWLNTRHATLTAISTTIEPVRRPWRQASEIAARLPSMPATAIGRVRQANPCQLLAYMMMANLVLWSGLVGVLVLMPPQHSESFASVPTSVHLIVLKGGRGADLIPHASPSATPTPFQTATPIPTFEVPLYTATPIPNSFSVWETSVPYEGGWSGAESCSGTYFAPVGTGTFIWPTDHHYLTGYDFSWRWHPGLDIAASLGEAIYAVDAGVVVYAGWNDWGYGNMVVIDHGDSWHTLYAHLSQVNVTCGQGVEQGEVIGLAGSTGHSTGPHLHFEMRSDSLGRVNPWNYLP